MIPQIYKSISEKQNKKQKLYIKVINALGTPARFFYFCKNYDCSYYKREFREYKEFRV